MKPVSPLARTNQRNSLRARMRIREITVAYATTEGADMSNTEPIDHHELRGRLAAIETLLLTLTAYTASHVERNGGDLVTFSAAIFRDVEHELQDVAAAAVGTKNEMAAKLALETHRSLTQQMMPQLDRHRVLED